MVLNDPCDPGYVTDTLGEGPGILWEVSGKPPEPPGVIAGGDRLGSHSALTDITNESNVQGTDITSEKNVQILYTQNQFTVQVFTKQVYCTGVY